MHAIATVSLLVIVVIAVASQISSSGLHEHLAFDPAVPTVADMAAKFGTARALSHKQTRDLYHRVVDHVGRQWLAETVAARKAADPAPTHEDTQRAVAVGCSMIRWRSRLYARSRDGERGPWFAYALALRDMVTHAWLKHSVTALLDTVPCLAMDEHRSCPSFASLLMRKKSYDRIIEGCWKTNSFFDAYGSTADEKAAAADDGNEL
jgi:hypothetical protein